MGFSTPFLLSAGLGAIVLILVIALAIQCCRIHNAHEANLRSGATPGKNEPVDTRRWVRTTSKGIFRISAARALTINLATTLSTDTVRVTPSLDRFNVYRCNIG